MPKLQKGKAYVPETRELERLFKLISLTRHAKRDKLLILMSYGLGLRVLELASLKLYHILNTDSAINENISLVRTKGNKQRMIYLPSIEEDCRIQDAINDYLQERKNRCENKRISFSFEQPLFLSVRGGSFTNKTLQKRFDYLYKMAGIRGASSHSGRRMYATRLIEEGADIKAVSTLMGHSSVGMTAQYIENNPTRLKKIAGLALKFL